MCLMLYIGTAGELATTASADVRIEEVERARSGVKQWFSGQPLAKAIGG